jgi:membrane-associated phospholipid phosphatase
MIPARSAAAIRHWWIAVGSLGAFIALAVTVHFGLLNTFDSIIRGWARPGDVWGTVQLRADYVVEGLRPIVIGTLLAAFTVVLCLIRRSWRPIVFVGGVWLATVLVTVVAKFAVGRPDTHGATDNLGGSFPSGHTVSIIVCLGLAVLVVKPRVGRWIWLIPGLTAILMGTSLVVQAAHWSTDVVGGGLLAVSVLAATTGTGWHQWSRGSRRQQSEGSMSGLSAASSASLADQVDPEGAAGSPVAG